MLSNYEEFIRTIKTPNKLSNQMNSLSTSDYAEVYKNLITFAQDAKSTHAGKQQYIRFIKIVLQKFDNPDLEKYLVAQACKNRNLLLLTGCLTANPHLVKSYMADLNDYTPPTYAVMNKDVVLLKILLAFGGKINTTLYQMPILYLLVSARHGDLTYPDDALKIVKILIRDFKHHAHKYAVDPNDPRTPLEQFINQRAAPTGVLPAMTPLELACYKGDIPFIKLLLSTSDLSTLNFHNNDPSKPPVFLKSLVSKFLEKINEEKNTPTPIDSRIEKEIQDYVDIIKTLLHNMTPTSVIRQKIDIDLEKHQDLHKNHRTLLEEIQQKQHQPQHPNLTFMNHLFSIK